MVLLAAALILGDVLVSGQLRSIDGAAAIEQQFQRLILLHATLPRLAMAVLCGAGLGISGAVLQQILRNPLAAPDTLAVSAGARLALGMATLLAPGMLGLGRDLVAIAGAIVSTAAVLAIARLRKYSPVAMILAGLVVSLYCGALSIILVLTKDRYLVGLFIWGSGSLSQQSWEPAIQLALRLLAVCLPLFFLLRPLSVLDAGEEAARNVGIPVERVRLLAVGLAVLLAAFVTSAVGVIGFIGLAAPALAALSGVRRFPARCFWSAVMGALLLLVTDLAVQLLGGQSAAFLPTGAVTAVIGSPLLILLLSRFRSREPLAGDLALAAQPGRWKVGTIARVLGGGVLLLGLALLVIVGRAPDGSWTLLPFEVFTDVLPWRLPRMLAAAGAGSLLAIAGYILQRVTGNPLASPELVGVSAGAVLGAAAALFLAGSASTASLAAFAAVGSFMALLFVLGVSLRRSGEPERVLLAGVAITALVDAVVGLMTASGSPGAVMLLAWMAGSASGVGLAAAVWTVVMALLMLGVGLLGMRWLAMLALGAPAAGGLGVPVRTARLSLLILVAAMTAIATPVIGPLTFVGLMAPHAIRLLGVRSVPAGMALSALAGASLMMLADPLARTIAFPLQLPTGILASLLAGPFLLFLIVTGGRR